MRNAAEIIAHRDDLRAAAADRSCNCKETGHSRECETGRLLAVAVAEALTWALGHDSRSYQGVIDNFARKPRRKRA